MEHESSLPFSQNPATCLYPELKQSTPRSYNVFSKIHLNFVLPYAPRYSKRALTLKFSH